MSVPAGQLFREKYKICLELWWSVCLLCHAHDTSQSKFCDTEYRPFAHRHARGQHKAASFLGSHATRVTAGTNANSPPQNPSVIRHNGPPPLEQGQSPFARTSAMEAIGFVASVGQISAYAFNILETMQKIRALARDGPDQLQEKVQQLDILLMVVCRIEGNQNLRDDAIARYLASIQKKIRRLLEAVHVNLSKLGARTFKGLLAAIRIISTEKLFDASFTAISQDCNTLALHIMSSPTGNVSTCPSRRIHASSSDCGNRRRRPFRDLQ
jgi:hypothetical protein